MDKRRGGCITILCQSFISQSRKLSQGNPCVFLKKIDYRKILRIRRGYCLFVLLIFCPAEPKVFVGEHVCVSGKSVYRKFFGWETRGVYHDFLSKSLSHSTEKFCRGTLLCFRKFRLTEILWIREEGVYHDFLSKFLSHTTEKIRGANLLCFGKFLVPKNFMDKRRGGCITLFCQRFCLTKPKVFVGEAFCVSEINRVSKNFTHKKGITFFCAINFLSRRVQKFRGGLCLCFKKLRVSKIFLDKRRWGVSRFFVKVFISQYWKLS